MKAPNGNRRNTNCDLKIGARLIIIFRSGITFRSIIKNFPPSLLLFVSSLFHSFDAEYCILDGIVPAIS